MSEQETLPPGPLVEAFLASLLISFALWILFLSRLFPIPFVVAAVGAVPAALIAKHRAGTWSALFPGEGPEADLLIATGRGAIPVGAIGYAVIAAVGISVPNTELSLGWRLFCGFAIGAAAGVACAVVAHCIVGGTLALRHAIRQVHGRVV